MARSGGSYVVDKDGIRRRVHHTRELSVLERKSSQKAATKATRPQAKKSPAQNQGDN